MCHSGPNRPQFPFPTTLSHLYSTTQSQWTTCHFLSCFQVSVYAVFPLPRMSFLSYQHTELLFTLQSPSQRVSPVWSHSELATQAGNWCSLLSAPTVTSLITFWQFEKMTVCPTNFYGLYRLAQPRLGIEERMPLGLSAEWMNELSSHWLQTAYFLWTFI